MVVLQWLVYCREVDQDRGSFAGRTRKVQFTSPRLDEAFDHLYPSTGRALFFSFLAMALGFGVLLTSYVPPLNRFGALVAIAVTISFVVSMTVLPAMVKLMKPAFLDVDGIDEISADEAEIGAVK